MLRITHTISKREDPRVCVIFATSCLCVASIVHGYPCSSHVSDRVKCAFVRAGWLTFYAWCGRTCSIGFRSTLLVTSIS
ncbi:hypothetical protein BKA63DRAFT_527754 [Paraphoma chrysanthemicola]|nr:hypothetical protein BKA63DRAFT_527754 [Paraphoma chrysanthemicola]